MGTLYLNRLTNEERNELMESLYSNQKGKCFICGKGIDLQLHKKNIDIDHIIPTKLNGPDNPSNFALTHASCNRSKQASDLRVARIMSSYDQICDKVRDENRAPNLGDVLAEHCKKAGCKILPLDIEDNRIKYSMPDIGRNEILYAEIFKDDISGFDYFFVKLPIEYLHHDKHINPRAIGSNLKKLVEEFHNKIPQLHVALGWVDLEGEHAKKIHIFDGQHKTASQVLLGVKELPVRVFINPNKDILLTANTRAGTTLRQVAFDKSVQRSLGSSLLADRMAKYKVDKNLPEDFESFSESDLINHFRGESREMKRYILDWVRNNITRHSDNKLIAFIDYAGRGSEMPLSYSTIEKTFYSFFISQEALNTPFNYKLEEGENPRLLEIEQIVKLMGIIADVIYAGRYDHSIGTRRIENRLQKGDTDIPEPHLTAFRMSKEEIVYTWLKYANQIIQSYYLSVGTPFDDRKLFQYKIPDVVWKNIKRYLTRLRDLPIWVNIELSSSVFSGKRANDYWQSIFEEGKSTDGQQVMTLGINLQDMIRVTEEDSE